MARMNPRRRRMAAQAKLLREIVAEHGPSHDDSHMLQQGRVKNALARAAAVHKPILPRSVPLPEIPGEVSAKLSKRYKNLNLALLGPTGRDERPARAKSSKRFGNK